MEKYNFVQKMREIIGISKERTEMPQMLKDVLDGIIRERNNDDRYNNYGLANISVLKDKNGNKYVEYVNDEGIGIDILQDDLVYEWDDMNNESIKIQVSTFLSKLAEEIEKKEKEIIIKIQNKLLDELNAGKISIEEYSESNRSLSDELGRIKPVEEYLDVMLGSFKKEDNLYYVNCNISKKEINRGPRRANDPRKPKEPKPEFTLQNRISKLKELTENDDIIKVNDGEYYCFSYDLKKNNKGEKGYIIIMEPEEDENAATKVGYLSQEEFEMIKAELQNLFNKQENNVEISENMVKAEYIKRMLENPENLEKLGKVLHKKIGQYLAILDYYLRGNKQINPELNNLLKEENNFIKRFPRGYLKRERERLLASDEER